MKIIKYILFSLLLAAVMPTELHAKVVKSKMYLFGFSASFQDSIIYMTDVQEVDGIWYDTKTKFVIERGQYSEAQSCVCSDVCSITKRGREVIHQDAKGIYSEGEREIRCQVFDEYGLHVPTCHYHWNGKSIKKEEPQVPLFSSYPS